MAITEEDKEEIKKRIGPSAKVLNMELANPGIIAHVPTNMTETELDEVISSANVEAGLIENINTADDTVNKAAATFAAFHAKAGSGEVDPPKNADINKFKEQLMKLHGHTTIDNRWESAAKFAGELNTYMG